MNPETEAAAWGVVDKTNSAKQSGIIKRGFQVHDSITCFHKETATWYSGVVLQGDGDYRLVHWHVQTISGTFWFHHHLLRYEGAAWKIVGEQARGTPKVMRMQGGEILGTTLADQVSNVNSVLAMSRVGQRS